VPAVQLAGGLSGDDWSGSVPEFSQRLDSGVLTLSTTGVDLRKRGDNGRTKVRNPALIPADLAWAAVGSCTELKGRGWFGVYRRRPV